MFKTPNVNDIGSELCITECETTLVMYVKGIIIYSFQTCVTFFLLLNTKDDIFKN